MAPGSEYYENLLKVEVTYAGERNTAANIFYLQCAGAHGATIDQLQTLATYINTKWGSNIMQYVHDAYEVNAVNVYDWTSAEGLVGSNFTTQPGQMGDSQFTDQVCWLLNYETNLRYRGGRGRMYIPAPGSSAFGTGDSWNSTILGDFEALVATLLTDINSQTLGSEAVTWVLYHRGTTTVPQGVEPVLVISVSPVPGTQRRRVRRVGHRR